jgi:hypothetical protein
MKIIIAYLISLPLCFLAQLTLEMNGISHSFVLSLFLFLAMKDASLFGLNRFFPSLAFTPLQARWASVTLTLGLFGGMAYALFLAGK